MNKKLNILRAGDQKFWAYYFIAQEHSRYTSHEMTYAKHDEIDLKDIDILYIHSPDITNWHAEILPRIAKEKNIKVIGAYAGNPLYWSLAERRTYSYADIIVTISPQTYSFGKFHYTNIPVIYMPESVDTNFFTPKNYNFDSFIVGWAGGIHKKIKRFFITKQLNFPIIIKDNWENQRNIEHGKMNLTDMKNFYNSIDVLILTSESECQPRVVMEAMANGLPVLAPNVGSMKMLLDEFCIVSVDARLCIKELNEKLRILKKYPNFRKEISEYNRIYIDKYFSWQSNKELWDNLFTNVYNNNLLACQKNSEIYLNQFGNKFTSELIKFESIKDIEPFSITQTFDEIISIFEQLKIPYCLIKDTCKNIVLNNLIDGNKLYFECILNEQLIQKLLSRGYIKNDNTFKKSNNFIQLFHLNHKTKSWIYNNKNILVPFPLLNYLKDNYGDNIILQLQEKGYV